MPSAISSIVAYCTFSSVFGYSPLFSTSGFAFQSAFELIPYPLVALAVSIAGLLFIRIFYGTRDYFEKLPVSPKYRPAIGRVSSVGLRSRGSK